VADHDLAAETTTALDGPDGAACSEPGNDLALLSRRGSLCMFFLI
jgi:hypothetical protein